LAENVKLKPSCDIKTFFPNWNLNMSSVAEVWQYTQSIEKFCTTESKNS